MESLMKEFDHLEIQLEEIKSATNNFDKTKVIGGGGFGKVYKGEISHSKGKSMVAIKRLDRQFGQGDPEFLKEIMMLSRYTHENLVSLLGFCDEGDEKILVYEHASNGSLDRHLSATGLSWIQRIKICLDAARGLSYLHEHKGTQQRVLHRDIKSANILLDNNWNAKVSDMGLSKIGPANQQHTFLFTNVAGTPGYCDPQYIKTYTLTKESDVYSIGVVLFEVFCGRLCFRKRNDNQLEILVPMWKQSYINKKLDDILFKDLVKPMDPTSLETFSNIAFQCLQELREDRPTMATVVEKLTTALEFQERHDIKVPEEFEEILNSAVPPLKYSSVEGLKMLLSKGVYVNGGKTWFSLSDVEEHCVMISIEECLIKNFEWQDFSPQYSCDYNSRFASGSYNTRGKYFRTRVRSQFLSPGITYTENLVFKHSHVIRYNPGKQEYIAIRYKVEGEEKRSLIVYLTDKKEDEWLIAGLYQFTYDQSSILDLEVKFEDHECCIDLQIEGFEFQPLKKVELEHRDQVEYLEIIEATQPPLIFSSVQELKLLLSRGVLLNGGKTWLYLNDNGQRCEMISIKQCLIQEYTEERYHFNFEYNSRFVVGTYYATGCKFKTRVRTQFLTPLIAYTVNLVFKFKKGRSRHMTLRNALSLKYKLDGETKTSISYLPYQREDGWFMVELYQFANEGKTVDFEITFEGGSFLVLVEGIEFQPVEKDEHKELEDEKMDSQPPILDSDDAFWEQKLPNDYQDIILWSNIGVRWTTKKELYSILSKGFLISSTEWFFLDENGKRCLMLSARAAFEIDTNDRTWTSVPESRFGEALVMPAEFKITMYHLNFQTRVVLPETTYACYLVFKLPEDESRYEGPLKVIFSSNLSNIRYIYLVTPHTPVIIKGKVDQSTHAPVNRPKIKGIPQQRNDGWMEVRVFEFQGDTTTMRMMSGIYLTNDGFKGVILQGIELRPL